MSDVVVTGRPGRAHGEPRRALLRKRRSSLLIGVGEDAALVAEAIADGRPQVPG